MTQQELNSYFNKLSMVPKTLRELPNWVAWKGGERTDKETGEVRATKRPFNTRTGNPASPTNPGTWSSFETAQKALERGAYEGIGFMFSEEDDLIGLDLDGCIDEKGQLAAEAAEIVALLKSKSYIEVSPSGTGLHLIFRAETGTVHSLLASPGSDNIRSGRKTKAPWAHEKAQIELYHSKRYFTVTGTDPSHLFNGEAAGEPLDATRELKEIFERYFKDNNEGNELVDSIGPHTNEQIINMASSARNGSRFKRLFYDRDLNATPNDNSHSAAVASLLHFFAFYTREKQQLRELFEESALHYGKWAGEKKDRLLEREIDKALSNTAPYRMSNFTGKELTDLGNAERFVEYVAGRLYHSNQHKSNWLAFDGKRWVWSKEKAQELAKEVVKQIRDEEKRVNDQIKKLEREDASESRIEYLKKYHECIAKHAKNSQHAQRVSATLKLASSSPEVQIDMEQLDQHPQLLNLPNGVLNLETGSLGKHDRDLLITKLSGTHFDENAKCPIFMNTLSQIFEGDDELIQFVQRLAGYTATGYANERKLPILYGEGRNGKSTLIETVHHVIGDDYSRVLPAQSLMAQDYGSRIPNDIAMLRGARMVTSSESNADRRLDEAMIKQLTGNERITARLLYGEYFDFLPTFVLWFCTNHKPTIQGTDSAIWDRILLIPFNYQIPEQKIDRDLSQKLKNEASGILNWILEGAMTWFESGLGTAPAVEGATAEYRNEMDIVAAFLEDHCDTNTVGQTQCNELYDCFIDSSSHTMSMRQFNGILKKKGFTTRKGAGNKTYWQCVVCNYRQSLIDDDLPINLD